MSSENLDLFGFGSYFNGTEKYRDIDLLVIHADEGKISCALASEYKIWLMSHVPQVHVTILSASEERELNFVERSRGRQLARIVGTDFEKVIAIERDGRIKISETLVPSFCVDKGCCS